MRLFSRKIFRTTNRLNELFSCLISKIFLRVRLSFLNVDKWHISATYYCRPYKKKIVNLANLIHSDIVIEFGCGLGEICSRINTKTAIGVDSDSSIIRAAKNINQGIQYLVLDVINDKDKFRHFISTLPKKKNKLFIAVNWLHCYDSKIATEFTSELLSLENSYLIIDKYTRAELSKAGKSNKFDHQPNEVFKNYNFIVIENVDEVRDLVLIQN